MARVSEPRFSQDLDGAVFCDDCPWHELRRKVGCDIPDDCPKAENYAAQCELAEKEAQR